MGATRRTPKKRTVASKEPHMTRRNPLTLLLAAAAVALVGLAIAGCGGGDDEATAASGNANGLSTIAVSDTGGLGKILVDSQGRTVYPFEKDTGSTSTCSAACAQD